MRIVGLILALLLLSASPPVEGPAEMTFHEWLAVFNSGDKAQIKAFSARRLEDPDGNFMLDSREDTGGFDVVKIEKVEPLAITVLLRERDYPSQQRLKIELTSPTDPVIKNLQYDPLPLPGKSALDATVALATKLAAHDTFSGVLLVTQGPKTLAAKSFGLANRATKTPLTLDTPMFLASSGKMFTGVAVLQLIEAGKIGLDDPVGKYLTDYPNKDVATKVTIRHLLTHRGGTGDMGILQREEGANRAKVRTTADYIALNGARGPAFEPGSKEEYSNYGFILLGAIIEKVTGGSYYDYVAAHVFKPAGMTKTGFPTLDQLQGVAIGYTDFYHEQKALAPATETLPWRGFSAGGGVSTAHDMLRFSRALQAGKLISKPMLAEATKMQTPWYGYGFISSGPPEHPHWGHGGGAYGTSIAFAVYPEIDTTLICMANRDLQLCDRLLLSFHQRKFGQ